MSRVVANDSLLMLLLVCLFLFLQGELLSPGDQVQAVERFTPAEGNVMFIKLSNARGWVPIGRNDPS